MRISVESERNNLFKEWPCTLCGHTFELDETVELLVIDGEKTDDMVCEHCAAELKAGQTARLTHHVFSTIDHLQWLTTIADAIATDAGQPMPITKTIN
jgi:protein-arginine kinase activator protein McsA